MKFTQSHKDYIGELLTKIRIDISISAMDIWVCRIVVWGVFIKWIINLF